MKFCGSVLLSLVLGLGAAPLQAMDMKTCGEQAILSGAVESGDFARIKDLFHSNPNLKVAVLRNSPGGNADAGYRAGEFFREHGISTYVSGYCRSSCSRFFLGGKERYFTDDYPADKTHVGFHSNYRDNGEIVPGAPLKLQQFVHKYSDGKADEELVKRWTHLANRRGFAYFYHPAALKRADGMSVALCQGHEAGEDRFRWCEKIEGRDALSMGVATSLELKRSCDAGDRSALPSIDPPARNPGARR